MDPWSEGLARDDASVRSRRRLHGRFGGLGEGQMVARGLGQFMKAIEAEDVDERSRRCSSQISLQGTSTRQRP